MYVYPYEMDFHLNIITIMISNKTELSFGAFDSRKVFKLFFFSLHSNCISLYAYLLFCSVLGFPFLYLNYVMYVGI